MGEPRKTPTGQLLEGIYKINYCVFEFENIENEELVAAIDRIVNELIPFTSLFNKISDTGGRSEFFISWYSEYNSGEIIEWELMSKLASLHIDIALDVYGTGYEE